MSVGFSRARPFQGLFPRGLGGGGGCTGSVSRSIESPGEPLPQWEKDRNCTKGPRLCTKKGKKPDAGPPKGPAITRGQTRN